MLNPVNQDHRSVIVFGFLKFLAHQLDKIIQLERNILGIKALVDCFLDSAIGDVRILAHFCVGAACQQNYAVEDVLEVSVLQDCFPICLQNVADSLAGHCLHLCTFVGEAGYYGSQQLREKLHFPLLIQCDCHNTETVESSAPENDYLVMLCQPRQHVNLLHDRFHILSTCQFLNVLLQLLGCLLPLILTPIL